MTGGDDDPRRTPSTHELESLLAEHFADRDRRQAAEAAGAADASAAGASVRDAIAAILQQSRAARPADMPATIGPYRVHALIGSGGMGEVWLAEQTEPFRRVVALKVIKRGVLLPVRLQQFAFEVQALALLNHDGIARLYGAGATGDQPWLAMEFVPGQPITDYCNEHQLPIDARLELFASVCRAVEHAHRQGVIHRDLKPANVLVAGPPGAAVAKIVDFGLAKAVRPGDAADGTAPAVGTPDYMSPEQADGRRGAVDTRTDVYALGVMLYELLTGSCPLRLSTSSAVAAGSSSSPPDFAALARAIATTVPEPPSSRVATATDTAGFAARCRVRSPRQLKRRLAGDLDAIVLRAIAKSPNDRYGSAAALADDVERFRQRRPIAARTARPGYLVLRFAQRHRTAAAVAALLALAAVGVVAATETAAAAQRRHQERAELFGLVRWLDGLEAAEHEDPAPARPEAISRLRGWLADLDGIVSLRPRIEQAAAELADPVAAGGAGWKASPNALEYIGNALRIALERLDGMCGPSADRAQVCARIAWAERVVADTVDAHRQEWERAAAAVAADPRFAGLRLLPQPGLVPLGAGPQGLQEFALPLPGAELPRRAADGAALACGATTCPVFVLLPGGEALLGSQDDDPAGPNYDDERESLEAPVHTVAIEPFFAAKWEVTNAQWLFVNVPDEGESEFLAPECPAIQLDDVQMRHFATAWGMRLPTGDEWEYLARAGASTRRWCGDPIESLHGMENLHDAALDRRPLAHGEGEAVPWDDGHELTAPVGTFPANAFGLHDVLGNAMEVSCSPWYHGELLELRGGSWHGGARFARCTSTVRWNGAPLQAVGLRPVITLRR